MRLKAKRFSPKRVGLASTLVFVLMLALQPLSPLSFDSVAAESAPITINTPTPNRPTTSSVFAAGTVHVVVVPPTNSSNNRYEVRWASTEAGLASAQIVNRGQYPHANIPVSETGKVFWQMRAYKVIDGVRNESLWTNPRSFNADATVPTVKVNLNRKSYVRSGAIVKSSDVPEIEATDDNLINRIEVYRGDAVAAKWENINTTNRRAKINWLSEGTYHIFAIDKVGNKSAAFEITIDNTAPETSLAAPTGVAGNTFTVSGVAKDAIALNRVYVQLVHRETSTRYGGKTINLIPQGAGPYEWSHLYNATDLDLPEGTYAAHVSVVDRAGNTSSSGWSENFTLDKTGPAVSIELPSSGSFVGNGQKFIVNATDPNGMEKVHMYLHNTHIGYKSPTFDMKDIGNGQWEYMVDVPGLNGDNKYYVVVRAVDALNNATYYNNRQDGYHVIVDTTAPAIENVTAVVSEDGNQLTVGGKVFDVNLKNTMSVFIILKNQSRLIL